MMKLIRTKYTIQLPSVPAMALFREATPVRLSRATARMAGQTVSTVLSNITVPINTPITRIPICVSGSGAGINQNATMITRQSKILSRVGFGIDNFCFSTMISPFLCQASRFPAPQFRGRPVSPLWVTGPGSAGVSPPPVSPTLRAGSRSCLSSMQKPCQTFCSFPPRIPQAFSVSLKTQGFLPFFSGKTANVKTQFLFEVTSCSHVFFSPEL